MSELVVGAVPVELPQEDVVNAHKNEVCEMEKMTEKSFGDELMDNPSMNTIDSKMLTPVEEETSEEVLAMEDSSQYSEEHCNHECESVVVECLTDDKVEESTLVEKPELTNSESVVETTLAGGNVNQCEDATQDKGKDIDGMEEKLTNPATGECGANDMTCITPTKNTLHKADENNVDLSMNAPEQFDINNDDSAREQVSGNTKPTSLTKTFVKSPYKVSKDKLSFTSRELQEIQARRAEIEAERIKNEKFRLIAQKPVHPMVERSIKPLTLPITPELQSTKRGSFRCANHGVENTCTPECERKFITAEELVARNDQIPTDAAPSKPLRRTIPHSPSFGSSSRTRSISCDEPVAVGPILAEDLVCRKSKPASPIRKLKRTIAASPALKTKLRASKKPKIEDKENVHPQTGYLTAEALFARPLLSNKTFGPQANKHTSKKSTLALMPQLQTMERANLQAKYRKPITINDEDEIEMTKQFVAQPIPTTTFKAEKLKRPTPHAPVHAKTPPLESIKRHAVYKESFETRRKRELEEEEAKRVFKANPMPVGSGFAPSMKTKTQLTVPEPFHRPGDVFHERHLERMQRLRDMEEETLRKQSKVKATPMLDTTEVVSIQPSTKPLTEAKSPMLALKRRMVDRAAYDRKEQERRQHEEQVRFQLAQEAERKAQLELKAWRKNELTFRALKRRRSRVVHHDDVTNESM